LISLLVSIVCEAERPVLLVPARHREKTLTAWDEYGADWYLPGIDVRGIKDGVRAPTWKNAPTLIVESYERISTGSHDRAFLVHARAAEKLKTERGRAKRNQAAIDAYNQAYSPGLIVYLGKNRAVTLEPATMADGVPVVLTDRGYAPLAQLEIETNPLEQIQPDLLIADEAHCLANPRSGVTRRVRRALERAAEQGRALFAAMTGTITNRSIKNYAHLARWALGDLAPLPLKYVALQEWASYLDEGQEVTFRPQPGSLVRLVPAERQPFILQDPLTEIRQGFARRVESTPGVISVKGRGCAASLEIELVNHKIQDEGLKEVLAKLRSAWVLPDDRPICDALEYSRHMRELSCGFYYRWKEEPPDAWAAARKAWRQFVNRAMAKGLDTEMQVAAACTRGLDSGGAYQDWRAIRDTYRLITEAVWISDEVVKAVIDIVGRSSTAPLVWAGHVAALERLGALSGWRVFGAGSGADLEAHVRASTEPVICSINACADGFNLQARNTSIVLGWPRAGKTAEQLMGRTHRDPTTHDSVRVAAVCATYEASQDLYLSWQDGRYIQDTTGVPQKLVFADHIGWNPLAKRKKAA
jgi:hypothetical protein